MSKKFKNGDRLVVTANHLAAGTEVTFIRKDIDGRALVKTDEGWVTDVLFAALKKAEPQPEFEVGDTVKVKIGWDRALGIGRVTHFLQGSDGKRKFVVAIDGRDVLYPAHALKKYTEVTKSQELVEQFNPEQYVSDHSRSVASAFSYLAGDLAYSMGLEEGELLHAALRELRTALNTALRVPREVKS